MNLTTKIALLAPYNVYPARTGGKKFIAFFHQYLAKELPVEFLSVKDNIMPPELQASFHAISGNCKLRYANPLLFFRLKKFIRENEITDMVLVHPYFGWLAWLLKKATGVKLSILSHNIESIRFKSMGKWWWRMLWQYEKHTHRIIDHNFFVTQEDLDFAVKNYRLSPATCSVITYGTELKQAPAPEEKTIAAKKLRETYSISPDEKIFLFNGTLDYLPNIEAVKYIVDHINPGLLKKQGFPYKIIICGKGLPESFNELKEQSGKNIIYAGFVDDIDLFFKGADIFLNPVITGGGIKTKLVEAIGNGLSSVSSESGAFGVPASIAPGKLSIVKDHDWDAFIDAIVSADSSGQTATSFFNHFYWGNIAAKAAGILTGQNSTNE